jgi:hypothetical protein
VNTLITAGEPTPTKTLSDPKSQSLKSTLRSLDMLYEQTHQKLIAMKLFGLAAALKDRVTIKTSARPSSSAYSSMTSGCIAKIANSRRD